MNESFLLLECTLCPNGAVTQSPGHSKSRAANKHGWKRRGEARGERRSRRTAKQRHRAVGGNCHACGPLQNSATDIHALMELQL